MSMKSFSPAPAGISRRLLVSAAAASPLIAVSHSLRAQARQIGMFNWGGDNTKWIGEAYQKPFEQDTGIGFSVDTSGPAAGKLKLIAQSGKTTWDVADSAPYIGLQLGKLGILRDVDYRIVDQAKVIPGFAFRHSVAYGFFSNVITFDRARFGGREPTTWADMWNLKEFPGKRTMWRSLAGQLEAALLADGVQPADLYPLDVARAFDKIRSIKEHTIFWASGSDSQRLFREGEVSIGNTWNVRTNFVRSETANRIDYNFNQGILTPAAWLVAKDNPTGDEVFRFINSTLEPERQVRMLLGYGYGPANPGAAALVPPAARVIDPTSPANLSRQIPINSDWYGEHYETVYPRYLDLVSS